MPTLIRGTKENSQFANSEPWKVNTGSRAFKLLKNSIGTKRSYFDKMRLTGRNKNYLLLNNNGTTVLGFAFVAKPGNNGMARVTLLATNRKKGYGTQIMNAIFNNAKAEGLRGVTIYQAVLQAQGFYEKLGYTPVKLFNYNQLMHKYVTPSPARSRNSSSPSAKRRRTNNNHK